MYICSAVADLENLKGGVQRGQLHRRGSTTPINYYVCLSTKYTRVVVAANTLRGRIQIEGEIYSMKYGSSFLPLCVMESRKANGQPYPSTRL